MGWFTQPGLALHVAICHHCTMCSNPLAPAYNLPSCVDPAKAYSGSFAELWTFWHLTLLRAAREQKFMWSEHTAWIANYLAVTASKLSGPSAAVSCLLITTLPACGPGKISTLLGICQVSSVQLTIFPSHPWGGPMRLFGVVPPSPQFSSLFLLILYFPPLNGWF